MHTSVTNASITFQSLEYAQTIVNKCAQRACSYISGVNRNFPDINACEGGTPKTVTSINLKFVSIQESKYYKQLQIIIAILPL